MCLVIVFSTVLSVYAIDSGSMVRGSSNQENVFVIDHNGYYEVVIGCEPIHESDNSVKIPLESFLVVVDYKIVSNDGNALTISNGNRKIELTANSDEAKIDNTAVTLDREVTYENNNFYIYLEDIEKLFSYETDYDEKRNNIVLTITNETPKAIITVEPPTESPTEYTSPRTVTVKTDGETLTVNVDGVPVAFSDAKPFIDNENRTQVPIRALSEMFKCKVEWNQEKQLVTVTDTDNTVINMTIGDKKLFIGDKVVEMDTAATIVEDKTYIPLRFLAEALSLNVFWEYED